MLTFVVAIAADSCSDIFRRRRKRARPLDLDICYNCFKALISKCEVQLTES